MTCDEFWLRKNQVYVHYSCVDGQPKKKGKGKSPNFGHLMYRRNLLEIPSILKSCFSS